MRRLLCYFAEIVVELMETGSWIADVLRFSPRSCIFFPCEFLFIFSKYGKLNRHVIIIVEEMRCGK